MIKYKDKDKDNIILRSLAMEKEYKWKITGCHICGKKLFRYGYYGDITCQVCGEPQEEACEAIIFAKDNPNRKESFPCPECGEGPCHLFSEPEEEGDKIEFYCPECNFRWKGKSGKEIWEDSKSEWDQLLK